ncbi:MAG: hypothetical protein HQK97_01900 [Nitrospirae bacterium]|nr:hypothetical protein [Nitrospirota bacterium]
MILFYNTAGGQFFLSGYNDTFAGQYLRHFDLSGIYQFFDRLTGMRYLIQCLVDPIKRYFLDT